MINTQLERRENLCDAAPTPVATRSSLGASRWTAHGAVLTLLLACAHPSWAATSDLVTSVVRIADAEMGGIIDYKDRFSTGIEPLGDLNGNGYLDFAVGAFGDGDGGGDAGAVYLIELDTDGALLPGSIVKLSKATYPGILTFGAPAEFGIDLALLGDYDGDGFIELAVGATKGEESGAPAESGQVWVLDIDPTTRTLDSAFSIGSGTANFETLTGDDRLGRGLAEVGDWDGDGAPELMVGAFWGDDGGTNNGAAYIVYLEPAAVPGTNATGVKGFAKLSATAGGFGGGFDAPTYFGFGGDAIGDLDGDGQIDLAIGAPLKGASGSVWIVYMDPACSLGPGTCSVKSETEFAEDVGGFDGGLASGSYLGVSVAWSPDTEGLFPRRLAVGAHTAGYGGGSQKGAVFVLDLTSNGAVASGQLVSSGFNGMDPLSNYARFGYEVAQADVNGDALPDLLVGTFTENLSSNLEQGALRTVFLDPCPVVTTNTRVYHSPNDDGVDICVPVQLGTEANPTLHLYANSGDLLTANPADVCVEGLGEGDEICGLELRLDLEGYEATSFTSTVPGAATNASQLPASEFRFVWLPASAGVGPVKLGDLQLTQTGGDASIKIQSGTAAIDASLLLERVADTVVALPEPGRAVGLMAGLLGLIFITRRRAARLSRGLSTIVAAFFIVATFPGAADADISVKSWKTIGVTWPAGSGNARLGSGLANVGDIDQDGIPDVIAGAPRNGGLCDGGEVTYLHFIDRDGTLTGRAGPITESNDDFGRSFVSIGDLDGDGIAEVAAGVPSCATGQVGSTPIQSEGAVLILSFDNTGGEKSRVKIAEGLGGFGGTLDTDDQLGVSVGVIGDVDGDGNVEIVVGAPGDDDGVANAGAVWIMSIDPSGQVAWEQKISATEGGFGGSLSSNDFFGMRSIGIGDLDGNGVPDLAVSAPFRNDGGLSDTGEVWILFLDSSGPGNVSVIGQQEISRTEGGLTTTAGYLEAPIGAGQGFGYGLASQPIPDGGGRSILYVGRKGIGGNNPLTVLLLNTDGTVYSSYVILETNGVGFDPSQPNNISALGHDITVMGDLDGDEVTDIVVGAPWDAANGAPDGYIVFMYMQDSDFDGLDDNLDNCPNVSNSLQEDVDGDGVGDLCDNCLDVANATQDDLDADSEGDACEPVELLLQTTGTPVSPSWDLSLQCGAFDVTSLNAAIVLPSGSTGPQTLTLSGASVGTPATSGPGLFSPQRDDAIYFSAAGNGAPDNRLCSALDAPVLLGTLTTGPIGGTQLAAAALSAEGVGTPGFGFDLASTAGGAVPVTEIRLANGLPLPVANLELGPAVETGGGTRWEVCLTGSEEFHRVAFGLIAPTGTTTADMRWLGCEVGPGVDDERLCGGGNGFSPYTEATQSWTVGPSASPAGDLLPHTMYVVLEGNRFSSGALGQPRTMNFQDEPVCIGAIELDGSPDLEPAITNDGVNDIDDQFGAGTVTPYEQVLLGSLDPTQVKLVGQFNPAVDLDGDGVQDLSDNCPFTNNPAQTNRGSFLDSTDESDPFGDACQCAEATDDGAVLDPEDFQEIVDYLAGNPTATPAAEIEARCSVAGTTECNIRDLMFLKQAIDAASTVVELRCDAALSPPNLP